MRLRISWQINRGFPQRLLPQCLLELLGLGLDGQHRVRLLLREFEVRVRGTLDRQMLD